ncbi:MAG: hypothetical protein JWM03_1838 [Rhodocyclales bacterium]|nr:hypothetical protein [Rhodocyclales bacterium]MDB5888966.1 hypothetical protein [Rhodocyclales bacterium]
MRQLILTILACVLSTGVLAASCRATASKPVALVELYSSEGCSSCPPADKWLATLAHSKLVPSQVVPLALHVPYWDYIGWRDRFALSQFEQRQREAVRQGRSSAVYTPQVLLNGRDFRDWDGGLDRALAKIAQQPAKAVLTLDARTIDGKTQASLSGHAPAGALVVLARYESGLSSEVKAGENSGVRLTHDNVVRDWIELGHVPADGSLDFSHTLQRRADIQSARSGLAAFVQDAKSGEILQAVMLPQCTSD